MSKTDGVPLEDVRAFWNREACGERYGDEQDRIRYELEPEILPFADFPSAAGKRVLEIGVGMGSDFLRWVGADAIATGIDLTDRALGETSRRLSPLSGRGHLLRADAEHLPFPASAFDIVYSWGVLHHSPSPFQALSEAIRVLTPGGSLRIMLYHRHSWVALAAWVRWGLMRGRPWISLREAVANIESPGTQAFTCSDVAGFLRTSCTDLAVRPVLTHWDRRVAPALAQLLGDRLGWFLLIRAKRLGGSP